MNAADLLRAGGWRQGHHEDGAFYWEHAERYGLARYSVDAALGDELAWVSRERDSFRQATAIESSGKELMRPVLESARKLALHWTDQEGVNTSVIDEVCAAVATYEARAVEAPRVEARTPKPDPERIELLEEIAAGVVDMLDGEPSGSDSLDWALERYGYQPTKGVEDPTNG